MTRFQHRALCFACAVAMTATSAALSAEAIAGPAPLPQISVTYDETKQAVRVIASIDIPAPRAVVWRVMNDCAHALRIVAGLASCRILNSTSSSDTREHIIKPTFPLPEIRHVFRAHYSPPRLVRFRHISGDYVRSNGEWRLEMSGIGTRVVYDAALNLTVPLPALLVRWKIRNDFLATLRALREEAVTAAAQ